MLSPSVTVTPKKNSSYLPVWRRPCRQNWTSNLELRSTGGMGTAPRLTRHSQTYSRVPCHCAQQQQSDPSHKILMVCMGNVCRSPMAQCVARHLAKQAGLADVAALRLTRASCARVNTATSFVYCWSLPQRQAGWKFRTPAMDHSQASNACWTCVKRVYAACWPSSTLGNHSQGVHDFDAIAQMQDKISFGPMRSAIKACLGLRHSGKNLCCDKTFPACAGYGVAEYGLQALEPHQQGVVNAAVAHNHFGSADQPFADVAMPGRQTAHQHEVTQDVDITRHCLPADAKRCSQLRLVQQAALHMGEHGPQTAQRGAGYAWPQCRDVPLQTGRNERVAPTQACSIALRKPRQRKPPAQPQLVHLCNGGIWPQHFSRLKRRQLQLRDRARPLRDGRPPCP